MNLVPDQLTLDNSAQEPIHISGWIQSHGVLLAFDRFGVLIYRSSNAALLQWLNADKPLAGRMVHMNALDSLPAALRAQMGFWCELLALPFGVAPLNRMVLLRKEQPETVVWRGRLEKEYTIGPMGPRLTPRGSFDQWRKTVKGHALPWDETDLASAQKLLDKLVWADGVQMAETARARAHLMAMLGHDLRDPLLSIAGASATAQARRHGGHRDQQPGPPAAG